MSGMEEMFLGVQMRGTDRMILNWFWDVLFERTTDSLPIMGLVQLEFPVDRPWPDMFGSVQKTLARIVSSKHKTTERSSRTLALSLLEHWYQITAFRMPILPKKPWNRSIFYSRIKYELEKQVKEVSFDHLEPTSKVILPICDHQPVEILDGLERNPGEFEILNFEEDWAQVFQSVLEPIYRAQNLGYSHQFSIDLDDKFNQLVNKEDAILKTNGKMRFKLPDFPILLKEHYQDCNPPYDFIFRVRLTDHSHEKNRRCKCTLDLKNSILKISRASDFFYETIKEKGLETELGNDSINQPKKGFFDWFWKILFEQTLDSLPIFGDVKIAIPLVKRPEEMFGSVQKYLSNVLTSPNRTIDQDLHCIALSLLCRWMRLKFIELGKEELAGDFKDTFLNLVKERLKAFR